MVNDSAPTAAQNLPAQLTRFVGRGRQMTEVRQVLADNRLVTLTGAGGVGKTRLAVELAAQLTGGFPDGVWYVDLAPVTDPGLLPDAVIRALGVPDQPGRSAVDSLLRFVGARKLLVLLDNCEHLLDATAALLTAGLGSCPALTALATSREPIGVTGEVTWRVPSLSLADEAVELFAERARRVRPDFAVTDDNAYAVAEICRRLDGMPLAIELAAARVRSLTPAEICEGLHDRFRLLTGGSRAAVRRQQTLRASVDWSHALLSRPERIVFRRLAVFLGGFHLDAAEAVAAAADADRDQMRDRLTSLVDKSLVVAEESGARTRYRLLETMRQYAQEKLVESGEADDTRSRHRDYYAAVADALDTALTDHSDRVDDADVEIDNMRAAFDWSRDNGDAAAALRLASALQPLWLARGRTREGRTWFDAAFDDDSPSCPAAVRARALADRTMLDTLVGATARSEDLEAALSIARDLDDPALLAWTLAACGVSRAYDLRFDRPYLAEAIELARSQGNTWQLATMLYMRAHVAYVAGDPVAAQQAPEEALELAAAIGDRYGARVGRWSGGLAQMMAGDLVGAVTQFRQLLTEADGARDLLWTAGSYVCLSRVLAYLGDAGAARSAAETAISISGEVGGFYPGFAYAALAVAHLAAGDVAAATEAGEAWQEAAAVAPATASIHIALMAQVALARGDLVAARRWADDAVAATRGWHRMVALATRARIAIVQGEAGQAEVDAHAALACAADVGAWLGVPSVLETVACLATDTDHRRAARLFGAADALRQRTCEARFPIHRAACDKAVAHLRGALGERDFASAWTEGAELSAEDAVAYARRGRGERRRPASGWESLTPAERDVARLVTEGLANKEIAARLFVSTRTVQTHLTHVYTKLGLASRVHLAQEAARHT